ncbi:MAG: ABC transporter substrate-binding protein [Staphylothermus sp.]|nr:ABC transporter substrate-binding protein [Staphylothermus sp.]
MNSIILITLIMIVIAKNAVPIIADNTSHYILVKDALERTINITKRPTRIVSLAPSITEWIFYLGLQEYLVGVDNTSYSDPHFGIMNYLKENKITPVGGYWWSTISIEKILSLKPDIVFADKGAHIKLLDLFIEYNITVVYLNAGASNSLQDIYEDLNIIATIYDKEEYVTNFINEIEKNIATYRAKFETLKYKRVLVVVGIYNGIWVAGKSTFIDDILSRLGLENVANIVGWKNTNLEKIVEWSPEIILIASMGITEEVIAKSGLNSIDAHIILLDQNTTDALSRPGPLIIHLPQLLYKHLSSINETEMQTETTTSASSPHAQEDKNNENNTMMIALLIVLFLIVGIIIGYYISRIKRG